MITVIKTTGNVALEFNGIDDCISHNRYKFKPVDRAEEKSIYVNIKAPLKAVGTRKTN